jgi:hypothetical protein
LQVETIDGKTDEDSLYVEAYDPAEKTNFAYGWAYYYPL